MHKRWIRRRLPVLIITFFIILYVDFQLRTSSLPKLSVAQPPTPRAPFICMLRAKLPTKDAPTPAKNSSNVRQVNPASDGLRVTQQKLKVEDIFIAVKTTGRFHRTRLALLLETWISRTKAHVSD